MYKGIDVSKHNGTLDWNRIKAAGIEFAIIRIGHGSDIKSQDDSQAVRNMDECERLGIPYGVYLYSYALNPEEAESEAHHMLRMIKGKNVQLGIWFDMEDADNYKYNHGLPLVAANSKIYTNICAVFTTAIQEAGYKNVGIYASKSVLDTIIGKEYIQFSDVKIWVAQWADKCTYTGKYDMWQYTSVGKVDGINGNVDMNIYYRNLPSKISPELTAASVQTTAPQPAQRTYAYVIGEHVIFSTCYASSTDPISKAIPATNMSRNHGTITKIVDAANPYLLDNGLCWVNGGDIRGLYTEETSYYPTYRGDSVSVVDALQAVGVDNSFDNRKAIAEKNGIADYKGSSSQNSTLLFLLKQGKLIK